MDMQEKTRENRLRRMAWRQGFRLMKSRRRDPRALDYGGFMLVSRDSAIVLGGQTNDGYGANIDDVERYLLSDP